MSFNCPHCQTLAFSTSAKIRASLWVVVRCPACGKPSCAQPIVLGALYFLVTWDVLLFGYLALLHYQMHDTVMSAIYVAVTITGLALLEFFAVYVPLVAMRADAT